MNAKQECTKNYVDTGINVVILSRISYRYSGYYLIDGRTQLPAVYFDNEVSAAEVWKRALKGQQELMATKREVVNNG